MCNILHCIYCITNNIFCTFFTFHPQAAVLAQRQECVTNSVSLVSSDSFLQSLYMGEVQGMMQVKHLESKTIHLIGRFYERRGRENGCEILVCMYCTDEGIHSHLKHWLSKCLYSVDDPAGGCGKAN